jgi:predicted permease
VLIGVVLRRISLVDEALVTKISTIVFTVAIPSLIFTKIARTSFTEVFDGLSTLLLVAGAVAFFLLSWGLSYLVVKEQRARGPFIQGSMRGNNAIISLAIILNYYGESGISKAGIILAILMPLYNVLSVIALTVPMHKSEGLGLGRLLKRIATNPIILAVLAALPFSYFSVPLPVIADRTLGYLAQMTLPLALINIGASLRLSSFKRPLPVVLSSFIKIILYPVVLTWTAIGLGIRDESLGILFIILGAPTAVVSFIMARAMDNDSELAANIIALTTLFSVFTIGFGLYMLSKLGLI